MSFPRRLEQIGIVVGSVLMVSLPLTVFTPILARNPSLWQVALLYSPGVLIGLLVALDKFPASYQQVWLFGIVSWLAVAVLWFVFGVEGILTHQPTAIGTWLVALLVSAQE